MVNTNIKAIIHMLPEEVPKAAVISCKRVSLSPSKFVMANHSWMNRDT